MLEGISTINGEKNNNIWWLIKPEKKYDSSFKQTIKFKWISLWLLRTWNESKPRKGQRSKKIRLDANTIKSFLLA